MLNRSGGWHGIRGSNVLRVCKQRPERIKKSPSEVALGRGEEVQINLHQNKKHI